MRRCRELHPVAGTGAPGHGLGLLAAGTACWTGLDLSIRSGLATAGGRPGEMGTSALSLATAALVAAGLAIIALGGT